MSLIYDALKEQTGPATTDRARTRASWWAGQTERTRTTLLLAGLLVLAVPLTYAATSALKHRGPLPQPPVATSEPQAPVAVPMAVEKTQAAPPAGLAVAEPVGIEAGAPLATGAAPPLEPVVASAPQPVPAVDARNAGLAVPAPPVTAAGAANTIAAAPAAASPSAPSPISIKVERRTGAGTTARPDADDGQVARTVADIESAMSTGDLPAARRALAQLDAQLPGESLTLLRMQAWVSHADNDAANAERLYRRIVERVPDDINAGVNIALLDARRGDLDDARQRLTRLSGRYPRSQQITRALAELDGPSP
ncbi:MULTISPECIES: tetratricopeptide repeat protein [Stenotrophomonas]|uniref:tetratricopeptide repeat protein n=1 Tax=Stenotrophomonas TaxID=40323 RepID=UPI0006FA869A|nr:MULTISPECIES: tetratricopeptide repeat protein [Stenotrophomonas]KQN96626.1 hypothetical protein ASF01_14840 [Stenotrophomonas sp. Leaf70]